MPPERTPKRVRQACEPCRRKKNKCPGEQPVCSHCARLRQQCVYAGQLRTSFGNRNSSAERTPVRAIAAPDSSRKWEERFADLEAKVTRVLESLGHHNGADTRSASRHPGREMSQTPTEPTINIPAVDMPLSQEMLQSLGELYLLYCDCQPLPLFHRASFMRTLGSRDPEVIYAILALTIRFSDETFSADRDFSTLANKYAEMARTLVMERVSEGPVELSTLQCLCLLSLVDFTNGNTHRSSIHGSLAMNLAQCANLGSERHMFVTDVAREERRRCFWSICLLKRLHGEGFSILDLSENSPPFPESTGKPPAAHLGESGVVQVNQANNSMKDEGIVGYVIILSEVFSKTARYVRHRGRPSHIPPWSPQSEYSKIIALQMEVETRMPSTHRFKTANLADRSLDELQSNRDYWGPWFLNQFMYHTILCLLNHPLLLSLSLRNYRSSIPEIFLQHTSDLIYSHTNWIIHFINFFVEKSFKVSDPFLGYSAAVVATIELQLSFTEDQEVRKGKQDRFWKCVHFVRGFGEQWPHMAQLAERLEKLEDAISTSYQSDTAGNKGLLIDLSRIWEILEYPPSTSPESAKRLFGESLYCDPHISRGEVSNASPLPEPTRLSSPRMTTHAMPQGHNYISSPPIVTNYQGGLPSSQNLLPPVHDEFSILAENFFSQGQDFLRGVDDWPNIGNF
ncbi:transcriptional regulator family: Fungal Specific TF [Paecilomyces variotii]|nr:transcriptional regulator family: Fungal Specific TF [Paecilomyces variotii]KAJ9239530.1 transcriptional regulator family: Fungal Specific TF [Paecilomyces variotii]